MPPHPTDPEALARQHIDRQLAQCGWLDPAETGHPQARLFREAALIDALASGVLTVFPQYY